jgi:hypothetical protein
MGDERRRELAIAECGRRRCEVEEEGAVSAVNLWAVTIVSAIETNQTEKCETEK